MAERWDKSLNLCTIEDQLSSEGYNHNLLFLDKVTYSMS